MPRAACVLVKQQFLLGMSDHALPLAHRHLRILVGAWALAAFRLLVPSCDDRQALSAQVGCSTPLAVEIGASLSMSPARTSTREPRNRSEYPPDPICSAALALVANSPWFLGRRHLAHKADATGTRRDESRVDEYCELHLYHQERNHQGLGNRLIEAHTANTNSVEGIVRRRERVGGVLNYCYREAA